MALARPCTSPIVTSRKHLRGILKDELSCKTANLRSILMRPIDILTSTTRIDLVMASSAPTIGAIQLAKVGSPGPMSREAGQD
jgi:hypothetical protein